MPRSIWFQIIPTKVENINGVLTYPVSEINMHDLLDEDDFWELEGEERTAAIAKARAALQIKSVTLKKIDRSYVQKYLV